MIPRVRPGVFDVRASARRSASRFRRVDFPTFERPEIATSGGPTGGNDPSVRVSATNVAASTRTPPEPSFLSRGKRPRVALFLGAKLRLIGLTGGIGSGKSTVARLIAARGIPVIDADQLARDATAPGSFALRQIAATWPDVIGSDGRLNRRRLGTTVFADPQARARLEAILHPLIVALSKVRTAELEGQGHVLAFYEASLLVETGRYRDLDGLVVVDAPEATRVERVMTRDNIGTAEVRARIATQLPMADKRSVATVVIENDGDLETLGTKVDALLRTLAIQT
jgi:dephospho-CoA kinase